MISSVNESLKRCLGGAEVCGYQPVGFEERLREAFDAATAAEQALMRSALDLEWSPSQWARGDLSADAAAYEVMLRDRFPELEALVIRALASRWAYQWR